MVRGRSMIEHMYETRHLWLVGGFGLDILCCRLKLYPGSVNRSQRPIVLSECTYHSPLYVTICSTDITS